MAIKNQITNIEELPEALREHYKPVETDGKISHYVLEVDGAEDVGALKRAIEHVRKEKDAAIAAARQKGEDLTSLEASWNKRLADQQKAHDEAVKSTQAALRRATLEQTASELAVRLAGDASDLLLPHIEKRLKGEVDGDRVLVRVLDKDGKLSANSVKDLEQELREDKRFAKVLIASKASGSGAGQEQTPSQNGGAGSGEDFNPNTATPAQLAAWAQTRRANRG